MSKPKLEEKMKAREFRKQGKSTIWIAKELGVAVSSVSLWTRDIKLTEEQYEYLRNSDARHEAQKKGARANVIKHRQKRQQFQEEGRIKAREGDPLHLAGCMLYWGEGHKSRNTVGMVNSDVDMLIYFMRFLREALLVQDSEITFRVNAYLGNGLSEDDIINYWLDVLDLTRDNLNKCSFDKKPSSSKQIRGKLIYGVGEITVNSTQLSQHIYGAIQEYSGIDKPEWLD